MSRLATIARQMRRAPAEEQEPEPGFREIDAEEGEIVRLRLRKPIVAGSIVVLVLVVGLLLWAAIFSISGAVNAPGTVRVENNSKVLKSREGGMIRRIFVREGQRVRAGQELMRLDPVQAQATVDVYQSAYDSALANMARFQAEAANASTVNFPASLTARANDPTVSALLTSQRGLFETRMLLYRSQATVLKGQADQIQTQIQGLRAQMVALNGQSGLIDDELSGVKELSKLGYAPKSRLLALQRSAVGMKGQQGQLMSDMGRANQAIGDIRLQIAQLEDKRQTEAADGIREAQEKLTENGPKLRAVAETLQQTVVRAPVDGYIFNLTQFTEGGVAGPGEQLLQVVPVGTPMVITAHVRPLDIASVHVGLPVRVTLTAFNPRTTPQVDGRVTVVAADATSPAAGPGGAEEAATREPFYAVQVKVDPASLAAAGPDVHLSPGMPAQVSIITGKRTVLGYLLGPLMDSMRTAMRER